MPNILSIPTEFYEDRFDFRRNLEKGVSLPAIRRTVEGRGKFQIREDFKEEIYFE